MVNITLFELHFDDASFSSRAIFGDGDSTDEDESRDSNADTADDASGFPVPLKAVAALGVFVALVTVAVVMKRLLGGDEPEVEIETRDEREGDNRPVGIAVDE